MGRLDGTRGFSTRRPISAFETRAVVVGCVLVVVGVLAWALGCC